MIAATQEDKADVVNILVSSFDTNQSVNYVLRQSGYKRRRLRVLMEYSFYTCLRYGKVFLSDDKKGCALILYPEMRRLTLRSIFWDLKLIFTSIGIGNLIKAIKRENQIKLRHPTEPYVYLWFIGVIKEDQQQGIGSTLLKELLRYTDTQQRKVYLETSALNNLPWYQKFGFEHYDQLDLGFTLFFFKRL